ncbi:hypothetical protein [Taibaiella koreensis]|uniref:hypothetical protein n=1 Tax=Taibaiella koreensis TaxID=1268548 RepID=UPI0013C374A2|nr:hypothetical protein [Taibaiella koreensis]
MKTLITKMLTSLGLGENQMNGLLDFFAGVLLVTLPWFFVSDANTKVLAAIMITGSGLILYAIFTDYRHGLLRYIGHKVHETLDLTMGVTLMAMFPLKYTLTTTTVLLSFTGLALILGLYFI